MILWQHLVQSPARWCSEAGVRLQLEPSASGEAALAVQWDPIFAQDSDTRRGHARDMVRGPSLCLGCGTSRCHIFSKENFATYRKLMTSKCSLPRWGGRQGILGPQECCPCDNEGECWCPLTKVYLCSMSRQREVTQSLLEAQRGWPKRLPGKGE